MARWAASHGVLAALRQELRRCRRVIDSNMVGIAFSTPDGGIQEANDAFLRLIGRDRDALRLGRLQWTDLTPPEFLPLDERALAELREEGVCSPYEKAFLRADGSRVPVMVAGAVVDPAVRQAVSFVLDISDRKRAEDDLGKSLSVLRATFEAVADGILVVDTGGRILAGNGRFREMWGLPAEVLAARDEVRALQLAQAQLADPRGFLARVQELTGSEAVERGTIIDFADGRCFERSSQPLVVGGRVAGRVWTFHDATGQRRLEAERERLLKQERAARAEAEAAHRRSAFLAEAGRLLGSSLDIEATLAHLAELAVPRLADWCVVDFLEPDRTVRPVAVIHPDPARQARFRHVLERHPVHLDDEGYLPVREVLTTGHPALLADVDEALLRRMAFGGMSYEQLQEFHLVSLMVVPLALDEGVIGAVVFAAGDSGRHFAADDLALAEELACCASKAIAHARMYKATQQAVRAREDILGIVSHDLRNPLTTVTMAASLITRLAPPGQDGEAMRKGAETIAATVSRMTRLIRDLLDLAAIDAGRLSLELKAMPIPLLVAEASQQLAPVVEARGQILCWSVPEGLPELCADRERVLQVLSNLIGNAVKFTPPGGRITVALRREDGLVRLSVSDTGPGIPPEVLPQVFERYWQARTTAKQGTGLGLAIAKGIVEAHGGRIWAESPPGRGATFHVTLPWDRGQCPS